MKVTRPTVDKNKEGNQCICNQTMNNCSQQCIKIINKYFFHPKKGNDVESLQNLQTYK